MDNFTLILMIFVLALFVGFEIITKVPPILHTPLMSGSNVISGITLVGAILSAGTQRTTLTMILGFMAVVFATVNAVGSFVAFAKLQGIITEKSVRFWGDQFVKFFFLCVSVLLGVLLTVPIGGADMPVVIALLNSYSGLAAAGTGFVLSNTVLIVAYKEA